MKFADMNEDCQRNILENLNIHDLLEMSTVNQYYHSLTSDIFRMKFLSTRKSFKIHGQKSTDSITTFSDRIMISDLKLVFKILSRFKSLVPKIEINFEHIDSTQHAKILNKINEICFNDIIELDVQHCKGNAFNGLKKPFTKLEDVRLAGDLDTLKSENLELNELFPSLRHFDVSYLFIRDRESIECKLPHLKYLSISFIEHDSFIESNVKNLIKTSKQITSLKFRFNSPDILKIVNDELPNLENIEFSLLLNIPFTSEVNFKHVKEAKILSSHHYSLQKFSFEQLEKLDLDILENMGNNWIDLITRSTKLKYLSITKGEVNIDQLSRIGNLPHLIEANIPCTPEVDVTHIIEFIRNGNNLQKFAWKTSGEVIRNKLQTISDNWIMFFFKRVNSIDVLFKRKSN